MKITIIIDSCFSYKYSKSDRIVSISSNNTIHYWIANNRIYLLFLKNNEHLNSSRRNY